ncbi:MAG: hypothetical protein HKN72_02485 [Gemmatimonadetes bacterium]|nr:hypothetical protein [Gemmatimonadota bacterium]
MGDAVLRLAAVEQELASAHQEAVLAEGKRAIASRLGLEFLVVVIGILAALAVDDWSQARSNRQLEEHLLTSLAADLEDDRIDAVLQETLAGLHRDAVDHLLSITDHPLAPTDRQFDDSPEAIDQSLRRLLALPELQVFKATFNEMTSTGSIRVVTNRMLRRQIASYYQEAEVALGVPMRQVDARPDLQRALAAVGVASGEAGIMPDLAQRLRSDPTIPIHALRIRQYFENRVALEGMKEAREGLVASVNQELENRWGERKPIDSRP